METLLWTVQAGAIVMLFQVMKITYNEDLAGTSLLVVGILMRFGEG